MEVLIFLGLVAFGGFWLIPKLNPATQSGHSSLGYTGSHAEFADWDHIIEDQRLARALARARDEPAREFLRNAREHLTRAYGELLVADNDPQDLLHDAFQQSWAKTCSLAEARFGEIRTTGILIELGFDRATPT